MSTDIAERLGGLITEGHAQGRLRRTAPTRDIWSSVFDCGGGTEDLYLSLALVHRDLTRLRRQLTYADEGLLKRREKTIDRIAEAFTSESLDQPWNHTRRLLDDSTLLALEAFSAALDGRFGERVLADEQVDSAEDLLRQWRSFLGEQSLDPNIADFLLDALDELRLALRRMSRFGPEEFIRQADHFMAQLGRITSLSPDPSAMKKVLKGVGVAVASVSAAVTLGLGVVDLDSKTLQVLPWGESTDATVVTCLTDARPIPAQVYPTQERIAIPGPSQQ